MTVEKQGLVHEYKARSVVIASGAMTHRKIPAMAQNLSKQVVQVHAIDYRSPDQLPPGAVLVIGGGTSGSQIAEELAETNRTVYLATSAVGRLRRRYRG